MGSGGKITEVKTATCDLMCTLGSQVIVAMRESVAVRRRLQLGKEPYLRIWNTKSIYNLLTGKQSVRKKPVDLQINVAVFVPLPIS